MSKTARIKLLPVKIDSDINYELKIKGDSVLTLLPKKPVYFSFKTCDIQVDLWMQFHQKASTPRIDNTEILNSELNEKNCKSRWKLSFSYINLQTDKLEYFESTEYPAIFKWRTYPEIMTNFCYDK